MTEFQILWLNMRLEWLSRSPAQQIDPKLKSPTTVPNWNLAK